MKKCVWLERFPVRSFLVDFQRQLSLKGLLSLLQEMAWLHAAHLGHGFAETRETGGSWVLARQRLEIERWPTWGEELTVRTWLRPPGAVLVTRDFELFVGEEQVGLATAHWLTIDHRTRKPIPLPFPDNPTLFRQEGHLSIEPVKLATLSSPEPLASFQVHTSDLDMNGHVNNVEFGRWVLDSLPSAAHSHYRLSGYRTNFLVEAKPGDEIVLEGDPQLRFQGRRKSDGAVLFRTDLQAARALRGQ